MNDYDRCVKALCQAVQHYRDATLRNPRWILLSCGDWDLVTGERSRNPHVPRDGLLLGIPASCDPTITPGRIRLLCRKPA